MPGKYFTVKEGMTFEGKSPYVGFVLISVGLPFFVYSIVDFDATAWPTPLISAVVLFFGVVIAMRIKGTLLDPVGKRFKHYQDFVFFKTGMWHDMSMFDRVTVTHFREQYTHVVGRLTGTTAHVRTWFVDLRGNVGGITLKECDSRRAALALGEHVSKAMDLPLEDKTEPGRVSLERRR